MYLVDGFSTVIFFPNLVGGALWLREKEVTPPALDGGGKIDTTTMRNSRYRTFAPKSLISINEIVAVCQYDPGAYIQLFNNLQIVQRMDIYFPDAAVLTFYGWIDSFKTQALKEGDMPLGELTVIPGNINPVAGAQVIPNPYAFAGTEVGVTQTAHGRSEGIVAR